MTDNTEHTTSFEPSEMRVDTDSRILALLSRASGRTFEEGDQPELDMDAVSRDLCKALYDVRARHMHLRDGEFLAVIILQAISSLTYATVISSKGDQTLAFANVMTGAEAIVMDMFNVARTVFHQAYPGAVDKAGTA